MYFVKHHTGALSKSIWSILYIKYRPLCLCPYSLVLQHSRVLSGVLSLYLHSWLRRKGVYNEMVIAMWTVLVTRSSKMSDRQIPAG